MRSIRGRLILSYVLLTLLTVGAVSLLAAWAMQHYTRQQEVRYLTNSADTIAGQAEQLLTRPHTQQEIRQLTRAAAFFGNVRVRILDAGRQALADSGQSEPDRELAWVLLPPDVSARLPGLGGEGWLLGMVETDPRRSLTENWRPFIEQGWSVTIIRNATGPGSSGFSIERVAPDSEPGRVATPESAANAAQERTAQRKVLVPIGSQADPIGYVELTSLQDFGGETMQTARQALWLAGGGAILLAGILGLWMGNRLTTPLISLTDATRRMSAGDLSARAPQAGRDEIGQLAVQFNRMAEQLQTSFNQVSAERDTLRRFIADASHELRTPVTALKNFNSLLLGPAGDDPAMRKDFLEESRSQIDRLTWITTNLLDLSRLDAGLTALELSSHNLQEVLEEAAAPFRAAASDRKVEIRMDLPESPLTVTADRTRLVLALSNLLDNAVMFSPESGVVQVTARLEEDQIRLYVEDQGPGLDAEDLPYIFQRFYRGRSNPHPGSGLGLAIVESVARAHGGEVWAENRPEGGARFVLEIPGAGPE